MWHEEVGNWCEESCMQRKLFGEKVVEGFDSCFKGVGYGAFAIIKGD